MSRWVAWVSVAALFFSGVSIGALGVQLYHNSEPPRPHGRPSGGEVPHERFMHRMDDRLALSPEQRVAIDGILDQARRDSDEIRRELRPRLEGLADRTREQIAAVLTDDQREAFDELRREFGRRADRFFLDGGPGGPRGPGHPPGTGRRPRRR